MAPVNWWDILGNNHEQSILEADVVETGKMRKRNDLSDFDNGQNVMSGGLSKSICKTAGLAGCCWYAVVITYQMSPA